MQRAVGAYDLGGMFRSVREDFRRSWRSLVVFEVAFKSLEAWVFVPVVAAALAAVVAHAGQFAVSNRDLLGFLLTIPGAIYAAVFATAAAAFLLIEQAGFMILVGRVPSAAGPGRREVLAAAGRALRIAHLAAAQVAILTLTFLPFILGAALVYGLLLSRHDINFYLADRPPRFWLAAAIGALISAGALAAGTVLYVRWAFAMPILLFEHRSARDSLRESRRRVQGVHGRVGAILVGWLGGVLAIGLVLQSGFRLVAAAVLERTGENTLAVSLLLAAQGLLLAGVWFAAMVGQALIARRLYLDRLRELALPAPVALGVPSGSGDPLFPGRRWPLYLALLVLVAVPAAGWVSAARSLEHRPVVRVTAHRGHARAAPENTLAAVRKAIESGADYAEVDVQLTADGVVVLLHDRDLKRVAGDSRRIGAITLADARQLDVGSWFGPHFAGERIPTLAEVIELARGRIKLNIELKLFAPDPSLARAVSRIVTETGFTQECIVTSFQHDALMEVKRVNPQIRTGWIVAAAVGDITRVEGEALSVRADWLTDDLLRQAHRRGQEVLVWTVNDEREMVRFMKRGVDNILTSDPDLLIRVRDNWVGLSGAERLLLSARVLLGLDP